MSASSTVVGLNSAKRKAKKPKQEPLFHIDREAVGFPRSRLIPLLFCLAFPFLYTLACQVFFPLPVFNPFDWHMTTSEVFLYSLLLPVVLFTGAFLGPFWGALSVIIFIGSGLLGMPLFSNGGGIGYLAQPGFGYIAGLLPAVIMAGNYTNSRVLKTSSLWNFPLGLFRAAFIPVATVHIVGMLYLVGLMLFGQVGFGEAIHWIVRYTLMPVVYDIAITLCILYWVRGLRALGWLILY
jgi:biotin transport system substrate-specific component